MNIPILRSAMCALLASSALPSLAVAQSAPHYLHLDENGVDLVTGGFLLEFEEASIGSGAARLVLDRRGGGESASRWDSITFQKLNSASTSTITIGLPGRNSDRFVGSILGQSDYSSEYGTGGTLTGSGSSYTYTYADGTTITFTDPTGGNESMETDFCSQMTGPNDNCYLLPVSITSPNGAAVGLTWDIIAFNDGSYNWRLNSVSNSFGYSIAFTYDSNLVRNGAQLRNAAAGTTPLATVSYAYPNTPGGGIVDVTDPAGKVWRVTGMSIRAPDETVPFLQASGTNSVTSVTRNGVTTSYSRVVSGSTATITVTDALNQQSIVTSDLAVGRPTSIKDPLNRTTSFQYDSLGRLTRATRPEGDYTQLTHDSRGNVTETRQVAKAGSGLADIVASASYPSTCSNVKTCNSPVSTTDARGNVTDYSWDPTHGGLLTATSPAPSLNAVRPQVRYTYALTNGEYLPTGVSQCQTQASCTGSADEVKSTLSYDSSGNVVSVSSGSGDGALTATQTMTYDALGNLATVDGPLAGTADTIRYRHDAARRLIGVISPDPDGTGGLKHRAQRVTYNSRGLETKRETGTVNSQSDADWASFSGLQAVETVYDTDARPVVQKLTSGGAVHALTQLGYDALGRNECSAQRMNPAAFGSLPVSACSLGTTGAHGPDRITKSVYNAASELTQVQVGVGTAALASERTLSYTANGRLASLVDAENNRTTYQYDGHDRLQTVSFPVQAKGANASSTADYEQYAYDPSGNLVWKRLRDGQGTGFSYDNLDRMTWKDRPGSEWDEAFGYDLIGRLKNVVKGPIPHTFSHDALGRQTAEGQIYGSVARQYDLAGRLTRLTWQDGFFVDYDRLVTGELARVRENGAVSGIGVLASFHYDDLRRRISLVRGNGTVTHYVPDSVSRLQGMAHDVAGTAHDLTISPIAYNPSSQIVSQSRSNDAYAWGGHYKINRPYASNGLNQYTSAGPASFTHDARGNLISDGSRTFTYGSQNDLRASGNFGIGHDALLRPIDTSVDGAVTKQFVYDGAHIVAVHSPGAGITERYVRGDGADELLVEYVGSDTSNRRWHHSDERGSIVALTDASGAAVAINTYDEYGIPGWSNQGRFQYTGQMWLPELGMYHYKNRVYSPTLGRFLQTDPIGYGDGMNMYAYVGNDPANLADPSGEAAEIVVIGIPPKVAPVVVAAAATVVTGVVKIFSSIFGGKSKPPKPKTGSQNNSSEGTQSSASQAATPCRPLPTLIDLAGKYNALDNSKIGAAWAGTGFLAGTAMGTNPAIKFGNNAIQVLRSPLQMGGRAITIGNVQVYGSRGPDHSERSYSGETVNWGLHEQAHTLQAQILGDYYLPAHIAARLVFGEKNPLELAADKFALGKSCLPF